MPDPDPAPPALITMGDPASPEGIPLGERGMTPFLTPLRTYIEPDSGYKATKLICFSRLAEVSKLSATT